MNVRRIQFAFASLLLLVACTFNPTFARAQYSIQQCTWVLQQLPQLMTAGSFKKIIALERQYLTFCKEHMQTEDYALRLGSLASALNGDKQHQDALGVANRCLQINAAELSCLFEKANALCYLGRLPEAKSVIARSLALGAITEIDAAAKRNLQNLLVQVNAALNERAPAVKSQSGIAPRQTARAGSAKVTGNVHCNGGITMDIDGDIDAATVESVRKIFDESHEKALKARTIKCPEIKDDFAAFGNHYGINSRGGSVVAAMAIGRMLRREHAHLIVDDFCISACVLILAGAVDRQIGRSAVVGIHRPYLATTPQQTPTPDQVRKNYAAMLQDIRSYLREMNVSEQLASDMLATPPERVRILTQAELKGYGLAGIDPSEQQRRAIENEAWEVYEANQLGLDRREYTRRKSLGINLCIFNSATGKYMTDGETLDCKRRVLTTGR